MDEQETFYSFGDNTFEPLLERAKEEYFNLRDSERSQLSRKKSADAAEECLANAIIAIRKMKEAIS